ncbi:MAG TPA: hypothetical protein VFX19_03510 [Dehalococcoidia bacterium]|nr:hypothetical protein [Dehalococcoidia bacterium]
MLKQKGSALRWLAYFFALQALVLFAASCSGSSSNDGQGLDKTATTANSVPPMPRAFDCDSQAVICGIAEGATEAIANRDAPWFSAKAVPRKVTCPDPVVETCNQVPAGGQVDGFPFGVIESEGGTFSAAVYEMHIQDWLEVAQAGSADGYGPSESAVYSVGCEQGTNCGQRFILVLSQLRHSPAIRTQLLLYFELRDSQPRIILTLRGALPKLSAALNGGVLNEFLVPQGWSSIIEFQPLP